MGNRRDLNELCDARALTRVHGGAMIASGVENLAYDARKFMAEPHKRLIGAAAAAALIPGHSSLFISIGTTTEAVARALTGHAGLLVITNNLQVATELYRNPAIEVVLAGGVIRHSAAASSDPAPSSRSVSSASIPPSSAPRRSTPTALCWISTSAKCRCRRRSSPVRAG